jgi:uncharacterized protein YqeY
MIRERINAALKDAVRAKDKRRKATLRLILAAIKDRDIAARGQGDAEGVSDEAVLEILAKMVKQRREAMVTYEEAGRLELVDQEGEEISIISEYLPKQMDKAEIEEACRKVVSETGASSLKDMGRVMAALKAEYAGRMDFGKASKIVKPLLG